MDQNIFDIRKESLEDGESGYLATKISKLIGFFNLIFGNLDEEEKAMFLEELGLAESGLDRMIRASYALLGLISYLTDGKKECRAWTIKKGTKAPQAAGKIHSDFERGFIRAQVMAYSDLEEAGFDLLPGEHPIVPVMLYDPVVANKFAKRMLEKGVYVVGFCYPVVPKGRDRIRTQISAGHTKEDLDFAVKCFKEVKEEMGL